MTNHVNVPSSGATPIPERTESTPGASMLKLVVAGVATVLVAAAVTATAAYLIADEAPTTGVFRDQASAAAEATERQLVNGIDPATDVADILGFGAGTDAVSANEAAEQQLVGGVDPAADLADILGFGAGAGVVSADEAARLDALVDGIDPGIDVRDALGLRAVRDRYDRPAVWELVRGIDPSIDVRAVLGLSEPGAPDVPWGAVR